MLDAYTIILIALSAAFIGIIIAVVVFMGYLRKILSIASFMGPNATIFAISAKYTTEENINHLLEMTSVNEVISEIKKEGYEVENAEKGDVEIEKSLIKMMDEVIAMLPEGVRQFSEVYMLKYDANIVKRILRAKHAGINKEKIYEMIYEGKHITKLIINHMVEATSVEDAIAALDVTPFKEAIDVWNESGKLSDVDMALDKIVIEKLVEAKSMLDEDSREAIEKIMAIMVDVFNIKTLVRGRALDEDVEKYIIPDGYELDSWKLKSLAESRSMEEMLGNLDGTSYSFLRDLKSAFEVELALDKFLLDKANELGMVYSTSSGPAMMFLISKEYEARNLKAIIKGFVEGLPKERISKVLVGVAS